MEIIYLMERTVKHKKKWACYILKSETKNKTYVGCTNDVKKRIRQHNGEIGGGAKATRVGRPFKMFCIITGFVNRSMACKFEWLIKHPMGKRRTSPKYYSIKGRLLGVSEMFYTPYFKKKKWELPTKIYILEKYAHLLNLKKLIKTFKIVIVTKKIIKKLSKKTK